MQRIALAGLITLAGCFGAIPDYTDEDAGIGYQADFAGEDLASGVVLPGHFHPTGYAASSVHGRDLKLQVQDCRACHGQDLSGGVVGAGGGVMLPPSCDSCHKQGWRTDCTYCHGTPASGGLGSPPRDLNGELDPKRISFPGHQAHLSGRIAPTFDCLQCHRKPVDVLAAYHVFDASPRRGENNLSSGLSPQGVYDPTMKQCNNVYCHGNGRVNGAIAVAAPSPLACSGCHPDMTTTTRWAQMSGDHNRHLRMRNVTCTTCHAGTVVANPGTISDPSKHVDGLREVVYSPNLGSIAYNPATRRCTGACHGEEHNDTW